jgi:hypothetical protein
MAYLRPVLSQQLIGPVAQSDALWLLEQLEHDAASAPVVYLDRPTLDMLLERGASADLLEQLTASLEGHEGANVEVLHEQRNSLPFGSAAISDGHGDRDGDIEHLEDASLSADVYVESVRLKCAVCGHARFRHRRAQLQSALASFFNVEWTAPSADCYICNRCGYVHWFLPTR